MNATSTSYAPKLVAKRSQPGASHLIGGQRAFGFVGVALILLVTLWAYWPAMHGGLVLDDSINLTRPELQSFGGLCRIWFAPASTAGELQYYPLVHTAFWIEHKLWGDSYFGYHLINVVWHSLSVVLLYLILTRLNIPGALLAAAIFAVHPVMVESVAWMTEQKNTLSTVFYLSAMLVYLGFDETRQRRHYFGALALFALALLAKTATVTLPVALVIVLWWKRGTLSWRRDVLPLVPFFVLGLASGLMTMWVEWTLIGTEGREFEISFLGRILLAGRAIWFYLSKLFWPRNLTFIYPRWKVDPAEWWQWIFPVAALGVTVGLALSRKQWPGVLAGWLLFCGTLFPMLPFLNQYLFLYTFVSDHFQYLASIGIIVLFSAGVATGLARVPVPARWVGVGGCVLLVGVLALLTSWQSRLYANVVALYENTLERNPDCWLVHNNLGMALAAEGKGEEAIAHYRSALAIKSDYGLAHSNLGNAYLNTGRAPQALAEFEAALASNPDSPVFHNNLASVLIPMGRLQEAIDHCRKAILKRPEFFDAHYNLGAALLHANQLPEASVELHEALKLRPDDPTALNTLGAAMLQAGFYPEAIEQIDRALKLQPNSVAARNNLGQAYAREGKIPQAIEQFRMASELDDHFANSQIGWGQLVAAQGKFEEAAGHFEKAIKLGAEQPDIRNNLGDAYRKTGKNDKAIEQYQSAVRLNPAYMPAQANLAQTLALVGRSKEAVAAAEKAIEVAQSSGQQDELGQFEEWLKHYRTELRRAAEAAPSGSTSEAQGPARTQ